MTTIIPTDGTWVGCIWRPPTKDSPIAGPSVVSIVGENIFDISKSCSTVAELIGREDRLAIAHNINADNLVCSLQSLVANSNAHETPKIEPYLLSPIDLQCIKACGVTFADSLIERVIEERAGGDSTVVESLRIELQDAIGDSINGIKPGSDEAAVLADKLKAKGMWSQYLEVGIGPFVEVFTKAPVLSSVGYGQEIGIHPESNWNNPEPELVLVVTPRNQVVGTMLGNDVNMRDLEGRSALLLGRAKDVNASCALGPFIRLFDDSFSYENLTDITVGLRISGLDGFELEASSPVRGISRDLHDLVEQTSGREHQYPDGFVLLTGTVFVPIKNRGEVGFGFTHQKGGKVEITADQLGVLKNTVDRCDKLPPWEFGIGQLMHNLTSRNLLLRHDSNHGVKK